MLLVGKVIGCFFQAGTYRTSENAYKKYLSSRPAASVESNKKVKNIKFFALKSLEEFVGLSIEIEDDSLKKIKRKESERKEDLQQLDEQKHNILMQMRNYRPSGVSNLDTMATISLNLSNNYQKMKSLNV